MDGQNKKTGGHHGDAQRGENTGRSRRELDRVVHEGEVRGLRIRGGAGAEEVPEGSDPQDESERHREGKDSREGGDPGERLTIRSTLLAGPPGGQTAREKRRGGDERPCEGGLLRESTEESGQARADEGGDPARARSAIGGDREERRHQKEESRQQVGASGKRGDRLRPDRVHGEDERREQG